MSSGAHLEPLNQLILMCDSPKFSLHIFPSKPYYLNNEWTLVVINLVTSININISESNWQFVDLKGNNLKNHVLLYFIIYLSICMQFVFPILSKSWHVTNTGPKYGCSHAKSHWGQNHHQLVQWMYSSLEFHASFLWLDLPAPVFWKQNPRVNYHLQLNICQTNHNPFDESSCGAVWFWSWYGHWIESVHDAEGKGNKQSKSSRNHVGRNHKTYLKVTELGSSSSVLKIW